MVFKAIQPFVPMFIYINVVSNFVPNTDIGVVAKAAALLIHSNTLKSYAEYLTYLILI
jgi:hypothetical protein